MKSKSFFLSLLFVIVLIFVLTFVKDYSGINSVNKTQVANSSYVQINNLIISVQVADTPTARAKGLSDALSLPEKEGMFFIFSEPNNYKFLMKDMNFSIDMIWIDSNFKIIYIEHNISPKSFPDKFGPEELSKYVLEVNAGFSEKNNFQIGDSVTFLP